MNTEYGRISTGVTLESFNNAQKPTTTFFYYGCNFKCKFCHNHKLLTNDADENILDKKQLKKILTHSKRTWKDIITVSGGEPTIDPKIISFLEEIKNWDFQIKLDTNGSNPEVLKKIIDLGLVDYIAMDIKGTPKQYFEITGFSDIEKINQSIKIIQDFKDYEFRTTIIPGVHSIEDMEEIGKWLGFAKKYYVQQFRPDLPNGCLDDSYSKLKKLPKSDLMPFVEVLQKYFDDVSIR